MKTTLIASLAIFFLYMTVSTANLYCKDVTGGLAIFYDANGDNNYDSGDKICKSNVPCSTYIASGATSSSGTYAVIIGGASNTTLAIKPFTGTLTVPANAPTCNVTNTGTKSVSFPARLVAQQVLIR